MITTSRTLGDRLVFVDSATWNSNSFAVTSGCSSNALNGPIRRPSSVVDRLPSLSVNTTHEPISWS